MLPHDTETEVGAGLRENKRLWIGLVAAVVAGHSAVLGAAAIPGLRAPLWGTNAWTYLGTAGAVGIVLAALATGALVLGAPPFPRRVSTRAVLAVLAGPLFYLLRDQTHLLGDGRLWISVLGGPRAYHPHEPLAFAGTALATAGMSGSPPGAVAARAEIYSVILGVLAVFLMMSLANRIGARASERWFAFALLAASGTTQFGFGYVEAYPLLWVAVLAYLWASLACLAGATPVWVPALLTGAAVAVHGSGALLLPSFVGLLALTRPRVRDGVAALAAMLVVPALAYGVLPLAMTAPPGGGTGASSVMAGAAKLFSEVALYPHGLAAWVMSQLSRWTLTAPLAAGLALGGVLVRVLSRRGGDGVSRTGSGKALTVLIVAATALCIPPLVLDTEASRGGSLDWDVFAVAGVPLAAVAGLVWAAILERSRSVRRLLSAGVALAVAGSGSFVFVNAQPARAVARYLDLMGSPRWTETTRAMAAENLAVYYRDSGEMAEALRFYLHAWELSPGNRRLGRNAAAMLSRNGRHEEAARLYLRLLEQEPADGGLWLNAGRELEWADQPDSARSMYREAIRRDPTRVEAYNRLARIVASEGGRSEARRLLGRSLELAPDQPRAGELRRILDELERD